MDGKMDRNIRFVCWGLRFDGSISLSLEGLWVRCGGIYWEFLCGLSGVCSLLVVAL